MPKIRETDYYFADNSVKNIYSGATILDKTYCKYVLTLKKQGFEIALHNVSGGNNYRKEILKGLKVYYDVFGEMPKINTFHEKNKENLYCGKYKLDIKLLRFIEAKFINSQYEGHFIDSVFFWGDIYKEFIKYTRLPFHNIKNINTLKLNPSMPFYDNRRPYVNYWFASTDAADLSNFIKLLSDKNLSKLKKENGACIIYTHFSKGFAKKPGKKYIAEKKFVDILKNLSRYNDLWLPTASEMLDRFLLLKDLKIEKYKDLLIITNAGQNIIDDLSIVLDNNETLSGMDISSDYEIFYNYLVISKFKQQDKLKIHTNRKDNKLMRLINRDKCLRITEERKKIEYFNYLGLVKNFLKRH
jgi:hypothetical protein